jgi:uncharacterized protein YndB with AHSA1/START domain
MIMSMTINEPSVIDPEAFTVTRTVTIAAPIDKVWAAITEPEHIANWFGQKATLDGLAVGASGVFSFEGYGDFPVRVEHLDAPHSIAYRWGNDNAASTGVIDDSHSTVFRFTLEPADDGTLLTVVETGFDTLTDPAASMEGNRGGWNSELDELVAYLEATP